MEKPKFKLELYISNLCKITDKDLSYTPGLKMLYLNHNSKITDQFQTKFKEKGGKIMNSYNYWDELEKIERKYICNESDFIYTLYE
jgi:hypothetical protein